MLVITGDKAIAGAKRCGTAAAGSFHHLTLELRGLRVLQPYVQGPSVSIDTACSSSLVTTHFVCGAMRHGGCGRGLSVGANLPMNWETSAMFVGAGMTGAHVKALLGFQG